MTDRTRSAAAPTAPDSGRPWGSVSQTVEKEGGDLPGLGQPALRRAHRTDAAQGAQQGGTRDVAADGADRTAGFEQRGDGLATADRTATDAGASRLRPADEVTADTRTAARVHAGPAGHPFCLRST